MTDPDDEAVPVDRDRPYLGGPDPALEFGRLFDAYAASLHRYLARRVGPDTAHDLVSETFLVALNRRHGYDPRQGVVRSWLYGIATNLLRRHVRQEVRALHATARAAGHALGQDSGHENRIADRIDAQVMAGRLASALAELSEGDRDVLLLTSWAGLDSTEIADALGIPVGTVRSRLHRVRKSLRTNAPMVEERTMTEDNVRQMWSEDELDTALAALRSDPDTDERALAAARAELMAAAGASAPPQPSTPDTVTRRHWGRWAAAAAVVVALVAGGVIIQTVPFGDEPPAASAAAELNSAADKIGASDQPVGPGRYRYVAEHAWWLSTTVVDERGFSYLTENMLETWVPADQKQEWLWRRDVTGARKWVKDTEEEARAAGVAVDQAGWPPREWKGRCGDWWAAELGRQPSCADPGSWQEPTPEWLAGLPRDPEQLYARLDADAPDNGRGPPSCSCTPQTR